MKKTIKASLVFLVVAFLSIAHTADEFNPASDSILTSPRGVVRSGRLSRHISPPGYQADDELDAPSGATSSRQYYSESRRRAAPHNAVVRLSTTADEGDSAGPTIAKKPEYPSQIGVAVVQSQQYPAAGFVGNLPAPAGVARPLYWRVPPSHLMFTNNAVSPGPLYCSPVVPISAAHTKGHPAAGGLPIYAVAPRPPYYLQVAPAVLPRVQNSVAQVRVWPNPTGAPRSPYIPHGVAAGVARTQSYKPIRTGLPILPDGRRKSVHFPKQVVTEEHSAPSYGSYSSGAFAPGDIPSTEMLTSSEAIIARLGAWQKTATDSAQRNFNAVLAGLCGGDAVECRVGMKVLFQSIKINATPEAFDALRHAFLSVQASISDRTPRAPEPRVIPVAASSTPHVSGIESQHSNARAYLTNCGYACLGIVGVAVQLIPPSLAYLSDRSERFTLASAIVNTLYLSHIPYLLCFRNRNEQRLPIQYLYCAVVALLMAPEVAMGWCYYLGPSHNVYREWNIGLSSGASAISAVFILGTLCYGNFAKIWCPPRN